MNSRTSESVLAGPNIIKKGSVFQKPLDLDDVLVNELGQFGCYQLVNLLLLFVPIIMSAFISEFIFSAAAIPHRCRIAECGEYSKSNNFEPEWILNAIPADDSNTDFASCSRFQSLGNGTLNYCPADLFTTTTTDCDSEFVYSRDNSVVYDFNLGCQEWLRVLAGTLNNVGSLLVLPVTGYISDKFGRKAALVISIFNMALFGLIRAFSVNYSMYLALQIMQTTFGAGIFSSAYIFATEFVGPRYRVLASAVIAVMFAVGLIVLGAVAWLVQPWRYMIMALHIPCFFVVTYYWLLDESVRWQLAKEKFVEAKEIEVEQPSLIHAVFKSPVLLRRVCTTPIWWITTTFVYYGLSINATSLSDTMYLDFILTAAVEIPGTFTAVFTLNWIGRKPTISIGFLFSATCNIAFAFIPQDLATLRLVIFLAGKFGISVVFTSLYLYTAELYPTKYRHSLLAFSSMIGRIGSITAPLTPALMKYWAGIPSVMFGAMGILSGVLVLTQPETLGTKMPDTLAEAEAIGTPESMRKLS